MTNRTPNSSFNVELSIITLIMLTCAFHLSSSSIYNIKSASKKASLSKNSPIYYISSNLMSRPSLSSSSSHAPLISLPMYSNGYSSYSQLYKLPIQFLSNAKPIEIIKGITKSPPKKVSGFKKPSAMSNLIYIPVTYLSNAKPYKVLINPFGRR